MKTFAMGVLFFLTALAAAGAQDLRDSVILESKTVYPQGGATGSGIVRLKVYITNKDSLTFLTVVLKESTTAGGAYMLLSNPRTYSGIVNNLTNTLRYNSIASAGPIVYNNSSPDWFLLAAGFIPSDPTTIEPPNAVRKAVWELKFDTVKSSTGTIVFDTATVSNSRTTMVNTVPVDFRPNFLKSTVTVAMKGDLNLDGVVSPADVVLELMGVFMGSAPPAGLGSCDLNCDGQISPADVTVMLTYKFLAVPWPC